MRITAVVAFVAAVHIGSTSIAAQQPGDGVLPKANTFENLFAPSSKPPSPQRFLFPTPTPNLPPKPTVVCGMTLIPGDPNVDPAIRREVPEDGRKFSIRSVDPKVCQRP